MPPEESLIIHERNNDALAFGDTLIAKKSRNRPIWHTLHQVMSKSTRKPEYFGTKIGTQQVQMLGVNISEGLCWIWSYFPKVLDFYSSKALVRRVV